MKAPVGLLSDRTVLRSKMEWPRPDKFHFYAKESRLCKRCAESVQPLSCIKKNAKSYDLAFNVWCASRDSNPGPTD